MAKKRVGEIRISKRIVRIGHEVYPLANISRVQTLRIVYKGRLATFHPLGEIIVWAALMAGASYAVQEVLPEAREYLPIAMAVAAIRLTWLLLVLLYRLVLRRTKYALMIETAGTQFTALSGTDLDEIHRIEGLVVGAIEDPPDHEQVIHVHGDLVAGDKIGRDKYQSDSQMGVRNG
ncbi:DUF6232 family protein [Herbidospora mongoliensis]|uniref:DUF6232 family protein n=1 Tax=Herbidospora mongoliensis TaxID=688067 RepID=UPI0008324605|nr:DUF6232 family protein [Herbidospora mongoliensis]